VTGTGASGALQKGLSKMDARPVLCGKAEAMNWDPQVRRLDAKMVEKVLWTYGR
jgi:hypothetical protein